MKRTSRCLAAFGLACMCACTGPAGGGMSNVNYRPPLAVHDVRLTSNVTQDGYCIVRVYADEDRSIPYLGRLNGNVIGPVGDVAFEDEPNYSGVEDRIGSVEDGFLIFRGTPGHTHILLHYDPETGQTTRHAETGTSLVNRWPWTYFEGSSSSGSAHFAGRFLNFSISNFESRRVVAVEAYDKAGIRKIEIEAFPHEAWLVTLDESDMLLLAGNLEGEGELVAIRTADSEGSRLDELSVESVTISPEFWEMFKPEAERG